MLTIVLVSLPKDLRETADFIFLSTSASSLLNDAFKDVGFT